MLNSRGFEAELPTVTIPELPPVPPSPEAFALAPKEYFDLLLL